MSQRNTSINDLDLAANVDYSGRTAHLKAWLLSPAYRVLWLFRAAAICEQTHGIKKLLGRFLWWRIVKGYGCYISPKAEIGPGLALPHPVGIVIGEGCRIGNNFTIYQGVTLGRKHDKVAAYPTIGNNVTIYAGATLIGAINIGENAVIGAGALVTKDVPRNAVAKATASTIVLRD